MSGINDLPQQLWGLIFLALLALLLIALRLTDPRGQRRAHSGTANASRREDKWSRHDPASGD